MATLAALAQNPLAYMRNLPAAQDWLASSGLPWMTQEEARAYLIDQLSGTTRDDLLMALYGQTGDLPGSEPGSFAPGTLQVTPDFDPVAEDGQYGAYVPVYGPDGTLQDVQFQQRERSGGFGDWLAENGWMLPLAAATMGATFLPGAGTGLEGSLFGGSGMAGGASDVAAMGGAAGDTLGAGGTGISAGGSGGYSSLTGSALLDGATLPAGTLGGTGAAIGGAGASTLGALAQYMPYISAGSSLLNGVVGAVTANKAAKTQANAANQATDLAKSIYDQTRADYAPWLAAGKQGLSALTGSMDRWTTPFASQDIYRDPSYDFRFNEGLRAVENSASARGQLLSGQHLKDLVNYGQNMASTEYGNAFNRYQTDTGNAFNRLAGIAGIGQAAQGTVSQAGANFGNTAGQNILGAGNVRASGYIGAAGSMANAGNQMINNWMQQQWLDRILGG